jgi:hemin uptake protein HemP
MYTSTQSDLTDDAEASLSVVNDENTAGANAQASGMAPALDSSELLRGNKAVMIQHNGSAYRLQATKLGKLILTK